MTPSLHCASMLVSLCLRQLTFALHKVEKKETEDSDNSSVVEDDKKPTDELDVSKAHS